MKLTDEQAAWMRDYTARHSAPKAEPVELETKAKAKPQYRPMTDHEALAVSCLPFLRLGTGQGFDKRFVREMKNATQITDKQAMQLWRIIHRYRKSVPAEHRTKLVTHAAVAQSAAPPDGACRHGSGPE